MVLLYVDDFLCGFVNTAELKRFELAVSEYKTGDLMFLEKKQSFGVLGAGLSFRPYRLRTPFSGRIHSSGGRRRSY